MILNRMSNTFATNQNGPENPLVDPYQLLCCMSVAFQPANFTYKHAIDSYHVISTAVQKWAEQEKFLSQIDSSDKETIIKSMIDALVTSKSSDRYDTPTFAYTYDMTLSELVSAIGVSTIEIWRLLKCIQDLSANSSQISKDDIPHDILHPPQLSQQKLPAEKPEFQIYNFEKYENGEITFSGPPLDAQSIYDFDIPSLLMAILLPNQLEYFTTKTSVAEYITQHMLVLDSYPHLLPHRHSTRLDFYNLGVGKTLVPAKEMSDSIAEMLTTKSHCLSQDQIACLQQCISILKETESLKNRIVINWSGSSEETYDEILSEIVDKIANLNNGSSLLLPGSSLKHGFLYEIRKKEESYILTIINTGNDDFSIKDEGQSIVFSFNRDVLTDKDRTRFMMTRFMMDNLPRTFDGHKKFWYAHKTYRCSKDALNKEFFSNILSKEANSKETSILLEQIHQSMISSGATEGHGRFHHRQGGPTCFYKSYSSWLKGELLYQLGKISRDYVYSLYKAHLTDNALNLIKVFERSARFDDLKDIFDCMTDQECREKLVEKKIAQEAVRKKRMQKHLDTIDIFKPLKQSGQ